MFHPLLRRNQSDFSVAPDITFTLVWPFRHRFNSGLAHINKLLSTKLLELIYSSVVNLRKCHFTRDQKMKING